MNWYEFDKKRVVLEYQKMQRKYPKFTLCKYEGKLAWEGEVDLIPESVNGIPLKVRLIYPDGFPIRPPKVYPIEPDLPKELWGHKWHRWEDGNICYVSPTLWDMRFTAVEVVEKIEIWYFNFWAFISGLIDKMPDKGIADVSTKGGA